MITPPDTCSIGVTAQNVDGIIKSDVTRWRLSEISEYSLIFLYIVYGIINFKTKDICELSSKE